MEMSPQQRLSLIATCTIIPLHLLLTYGFTFTSPRNITGWHWAFVWFTFLLNIPAILASWNFPRFSAFWVLINTAVSLCIAAGFLVRSYMEGRAEGDGLFTAIALAAMRVTVMATFLWLPQVLFAGTMLRYLKRSQAPNSYSQ